MTTADDIARLALERTRGAANEVGAVVGNLTEQDSLDAMEVLYQGTNPGYYLSPERCLHHAAAEIVQAVAWQSTGVEPDFDSVWQRDTGALEWTTPPGGPGGKWEPRKYEATVWHNQGRHVFAVVTRMSEQKAVAIAAGYFFEKWPTLRLMDIQLTHVGTAEQARTEDGLIYPPPGNPNNEAFDPLEWM